jgi:hypothetical protein
MWNYLYYLASVGAISTIGYGLLYCYDRRMAEDLATQISWNGVRAYHKVNLEINNLKRLYKEECRRQRGRTRTSSSDDDIEKECESTLEENKLEFIGYNTKDDTTYKSYNIVNNDYINDNNFKLMFLKKIENEEVLYKRLNNKDEINVNIKMKKIKKPFIQVELCQGEMKKSIHNKLESFYIEGNKLFDESFLKWYVLTFYSILLEDTYSLRIIDSDINMFNIEKGQFINLNENKKYEVKSINADEK